MNLPALTLQHIWLHLAWAVVLGAVFLGVWGDRWEAHERVKWGLLAALIVAVAAPWQGSPVAALGLAFQSPSLLFVALCASSVVRAIAQSWPGREAHADPAVPARHDQALPFALAVAIALAGVLLYADTLSSMALNMYAFGAEPRAGAALATGAALAAWWLAWREARWGAGVAVLLALLVFSVTHLPTGNVWDAVLDPWLWLWSLGRLLGLAYQRFRDLLRERRSASAADRN